LIKKILAMPTKALVKIYHYLTNTAQNRLEKTLFKAQETRKTEPSKDLKPEGRKAEKP
jgi:hypothetical protein